MPSIFKRPSRRGHPGSIFHKRCRISKGKRDRQPGNTSFTAVRRSAGLSSTIFRVALPIRPKPLIAIFSICLFLTIISNRTAALITLLRWWSDACNLSHDYGRTLEI